MDIERKEKSVIALQLKYLLALSSKENENDTLNVLNTLYPFNNYPLNKLPPLELFQTKQANQITNNIQQQLKNYCYVIILGKLVLKKSSFRFSENHFIDQNIQEKLIFELSDDTSLHTSLQHTVYLKIHKIWTHIAYKHKKNAEQNYIKSKLIKVPFFANLTFNEFHKCLQAARIKILGPEEVLVAEGQVPYYMYVVTEGELSYNKKVAFSKNNDVWSELKVQLERDDPVCKQMCEYLVRDPSPSHPQFTVEFQIKLIGYGQVICGQQTLSQTALPYTIRSTLKTRLICLKYPDLYLLSTGKLAQIRLWPKIEADIKKLRKNYYLQLKWQQFKQYLRLQNKLDILQHSEFQSYLRKDVNLNENKYEYVADRIGHGRLISSPIMKFYKVVSLTCPNESYSD